MRIYLRIAHEIIARALIPDYPLVSKAVRRKIAFDASIFIKKQLSLQPYYILYPLVISGSFLAISIYIFGPRATVFWKKLPLGSMIERLFRSLVMIKFFEDDAVLDVLGLKTGKERAEYYRIKRNGRLHP